jgi:vacuolar-type H+-ATPase subunit E/Vma4
MDKKILEKINEENAQVICAKISLDADEEIKSILDGARKESEKILGQAKSAAESNKQAVLKNLEREIQKSREKILSSLNLEKKRLVLGEKDKFVRSVLEEVKNKSEGFRAESAYPEFLERSIVEGIKVIEECDIEVFYSYQDEHLFNESFVKKIKAASFAVMKKDCDIKFKKADFKDLGVIVNSTGGRMMYDNRFLTRLERSREEIYMELLKESF